MRTRNFEGIDIPTAWSVEVFDCGDPECHAVHLIGRDETGVPVFEIVCNEISVNKMLDLIASKTGHHVHRVN